MGKSSYKATAWILIIAGIIYAITNLYFSFGGPTMADKLYELGFGSLYSALILALSFFPGRYYLAIASDGAGRDKLTDASLVLTIAGMLLVLAAFFAMLIMCPPPSFCYGWGLMIVFYGIFPAAASYAIAVILLSIKMFKNG